MPCPTCDGERWLCEEHPDKPMTHDGCTGAGDPCPDCQPADRPLHPPGFTTIARVGPPALVEGDEVKCWRCVGWHVLHQSGTPGPYDRAMLYITCGGGEYYAGNAGNVTARLVRTASR